MMNNIIEFRFDLRLVSIVLFRNCLGEDSVATEDVQTLGLSVAIM